MDLRDPDDREVSAVLVQPKRLALLVYLAKTSLIGFQRRDLLLPMFWPELPEAGARNALRQALHQLRRALGKEVILARGADALAVNGELLWCDASAFDAALSRGALDEAITLYGGDFLPGFAVEGAAEFDRWLDDSRTMLRHRATRAAWALADRNERAGNATAAVDYARWAAALAGHDEAGLRQLVTLLDRVGDDVGALDAYTEFAHRLERDLGSTPSSETTALVEAIRTRSRVAGPVAPAPRRTEANARPQVSIAPFQNLTGDPASDFIGRLMSDTIAQGIVESRLADLITNGGGDLSAEASPDARYGIRGSYFLNDDMWCFQARLEAPTGGRVFETIGDVMAPRQRPWQAADELRSRLTGMLAGRLDPRFASWANAMAQAPNLEAHRELALGAELHLRGDFRAAIPYLLRAANSKEGFALPILWAIQSSCNLEEWEQAEALLAELTSPSHRNRLSAFEKLGCDYYAACLDGQRGTALRIARLAAEMVPDSEVLSQLGREALFCNHPRAAIDALERLDPERGWIPSWTPHWRRLTESYHMLGDHVRELDAARRGRSHHPEAISAVLYEARALAATGDVQGVVRCVDEACAFPADRFATAGDIMLDVTRELGAHGNRPGARAMASRAIAWYQERQTDGETNAEQLALVRAYYANEEWESAQRIATSLASRTPDDIQIIGLCGTIAARLNQTADAREAVTVLKAKTGRFRFGSQFAWTARILALLGEKEQALVTLRGAFARGYCYGVELHADMDLALLNDEPAFRELLRPKG